MRTTLKCPEGFKIEGINRLVKLKPKKEKPAASEKPADKKAAKKE